jgi:hypothetical protein
MNQNLFLRVLLAIINAARWLAPPSRRREWRRQWRADIQHEWNWLERNPRGVAGPASLAGRTAGAFQHAFGCGASSASRRTCATAGGRCSAARRHHRRHPHARPRHRRQRHDVQLAGRPPARSCSTASIVPIASSR